MKRMIQFVLVALMFGLSASAAYIWKGKGKKVTATTTAQVVSLDAGEYAYSASIENLGVETVWVQIGTTTNGFATTNAIPVDSTPYSFGSVKSEDRGRQITGVIIATTNGTSEVNIAFQ